MIRIASLVAGAAVTSYSVNRITRSGAEANVCGAGTTSYMTGTRTAAEIPSPILLDWKPYTFRTRDDAVKRDAMFSGDSFLARLGNLLFQGVGFVGHETKGWDDKTLGMPEFWLQHDADGHCQTQHACVRGDGVVLASHTNGVFVPRPATHACASPWAKHGCVVDGNLYLRKSNLSWDDKLTLAIAGVVLPDRHDTLEDPFGPESARRSASVSSSSR